jgi:hypothetical protein
MMKQCVGKGGAKDNQVEVPTMDPFSALTIFGFWVAARIIGRERIGLASIRRGVRMYLSRIHFY